MAASPRPDRLDHEVAEEPTLPPPVATLNTPSSTSTPNSHAAATGSKRPAPSLLPAFEPLSSSPALPRPLKRRNTGVGLTNGNNVVGGDGGKPARDAYLKYPTPVPTSSTGILSSSPPRASAPSAGGARRPTLTRTTSERAPLSAVPAVEIPDNGEIMTMGRSSNSSHVQLSANRLISRVHVRARYVAASDPLEANRIEIVCNGWNGLKLHCQGRTWELFKGDSFTSETEGAEIMVDVQDARVMIQWPRRGGGSAADNLANLSDSSWDDSPRSKRHEHTGLLQSSPLRRTARILSPESPTPATNLSSSQRLQALLPPNDDDDKENAGSWLPSDQADQAEIHIFEDREPQLPPPQQALDGAVNVNVSMRTEATASFSSDLSDLEDENDPDEENDPIVHSFGPFGADIQGRMASITTRSPGSPLKRPQNGGRQSSSDTLTPNHNLSEPASPKKLAKQDSSAPISSIEQPASTTTASITATDDATEAAAAQVSSAVRNHVINQLAYSRLSSTPLSTIMANLPAEEKRDLAREVLRTVIEATTCIGIIERQGKDAAGKALESEYYYVPERDDDEQRRAAVVDGLRKPSLRNCRKQHKQYYWKRPRTP